MVRATVYLGLLVIITLIIGSAAAQSSDDLDLREANVVEVDYSEESNGYGFDVTLYHDDGESGYANWWQVETLDGEKIGRRELLHPHGTRKFTRSEIVELPKETTYVVIRGHDQNHGYGGRAVVLNVETGETDAIYQGSEPRDFSNYLTETEEETRTSVEKTETVREEEETVEETGEETSKPTSTKRKDTRTPDKTSTPGAEEQPSSNGPGALLALCSTLAAALLLSRA